MAELVGVIASGVSIGTLAAQIGSSIATLKGYLDEVNEAPEAISSLLEDIEDLYSILADIEDDQGRNPFSSLILDNISTSKCLIHCRSAAERLKELVDEVGADIDAPCRFKKNRAALKIVLKGKKIQRYKDKLERTVRLLNLSQQCYTRSLLKLQPEIITARLSRTVIPSPYILSMDRSKDYQVSHSSVSGNLPNYKAPSTITPRFKMIPPTASSYLFDFLSYERKRVVPARKRSKNTQSQGEEGMDEISAYFRAPAWLINRAWAIEGRRACSGWNFSLSTYNIIPSDSLVFKYAQNGTVNDLQGLFQNHLASPFDVDEYGHTVLHHSARRSKLAECQFLIESGALRNALDSHNVTPLGLLAREGFADPNSKKGDLDLARLLLNEVELNVEFFCQFGGPEDALLLFQQESNPPYYTNSFHDRASIAFSLIDKPFTTAKMFQLALSRESLKPESYKYKDDTGNSLLHAVAGAIGLSLSRMLCRVYQRNRWQRPHHDFMGWLELLIEYVDAGCDIHGVRLDNKPITSRRTPFLEVIHGFLNLSWMHTGTNPNKIEALMRCYVMGLKEGGIDLVSYGRKERELHSQQFVDKTFRYQFWPTKMKGLGCTSCATWDLIGFTYGPSPDDWRIWESQPTDIFAGEFWHMIENPWGRVPGAWVD